jgi:lipoprotein signal peptidase
VFNIADAFVCVGCGLMLLWCITSMIQDYKIEKAKKNTANEEAVVESEEE